MSPVQAYLEVGKKKVFACALDWPGWCRSGRDEAQALAALAAYAGRYAAIPEEARLEFPVRATDQIEVIERLTGNATTDFGAPDRPASMDEAPLAGKEAERIASLVSAAWRVLDRTVATAPLELRKGPRGGGRDRDRIVDHLLGAESSYARKIGVRLKQPAQDDAAAVAELREAILRAIATAREPVLIEGGWPVRYAARRIAWHVIDHIWEIEDRSSVGE